MSAASPNSKAGKAAAEKIQSIEAARKEADARAAERRRLLASSDPKDWTTLIAKSPDSKEANNAREKQRLGSSICADLPQLTSQLKAGASALVAVMPDFKILNRSAEGKGGGAIMDNFFTMAKKCRENAQRYRDSASDVRQHGILKGEEQVAAEIATAFDTISTGFKKYAEFLGQTMDAAGSLIELDQLFRPLPNVTDKLIEQEVATCSRLASASASVTPNATTSAAP